MLDFWPFVQVIFIDLILSGDNAVIIGALAATLPTEQRNKAILYGMALAVIMRIILSLGIVYVLMIPGVLVLGGLLLFYVAYGMWKDLRDDGSLNDSTETIKPRTFAGALAAIAMADLSMSLDNVLAVAGAARDHVYALVFGLVLSIILMAFAAKFVSSLIDKHKWVAYVGLALIIFIAAKMCYEGYPQVVGYLA